MASLTDLSILHLAVAVEDALESLQEGYGKHVLDEQALAAIEQTRVDGPAHGRLKEAYQELNHAMATNPVQPGNLGLLEAMLKLEMLARNFYEGWQSQLEDPELQKLFGEMAAEEQGHANLIEAQLRRIRQKI